ncbi:hypothetical protein [Streptomyces sp. MT206]|uniref:hypothetical protein n=1 Tax=Streptomyces sp. MT206 TaxID=3031407 RepID=UPI002FC76BA8
MNATKDTINGLKVIAWEYAETPRSKPTDRRYYEEVIKVLLEDNSEVFACIWQGCEFTRDSASGVWPHLKVHKRKDKKTSFASPVNVSDLSVSELIGRAQQAETYRSQRDVAVRELQKATKELAEWKPRAKAAEKQIQTIRSAFSAVA